MTTSVLDIMGTKHRARRLRSGQLWVVSGNTVYNISGIGNVGEGNSYDADGLYCDGCAFVSFERNAIFQVDYGIETTSENQVCQATGTEWSLPNHTGTAARGKLPCYGMDVTVRNNLFYYENACGNSIGGYALATSKGGGSNGGGSSYATSLSTTLSSTTVPSQVTILKAHRAAISRFSTR